MTKSRIACIRDPFGHRFEVWHGGFSLRTFTRERATSLAVSLAAEPPLTRADFAVRAQRLRP